MKNKSKLVLLGLCSMLMLGACNGQTVTSESKPENPSSESEPSSSEETYSLVLEEAFEMNVGATHKIVATLQGYKENELSYSSYDGSVATVATDGTVTAVKEGNTQILVKATSGSHTERKTVSVKVVDPNKLSGLIPFATAKDMAGLTADETSIDYTGAPIINYGWDIVPGMSHGESTATKFDFEGTKELTEKVGRGAALEGANVYSGDYVVIMREGNNEVETGKTAAVSYFKGDVSQWAETFRLWGWSSVNDADDHALSGAGKFRLVAYKAKNENYTEFDTIPLVAMDAGELEQDENGWIAFSEVSNAAEGQIKGAPEYNMFVYAVSIDGKYDLRGQEDLIFACELQAANTTTGKYDAFGIKRWGFTCGAKPSIALTTEASVELFATKTSQIGVNLIGDAANGTTSYVSSDTTVATVSDTGLITAGDVTEEKTCTITITNDKVAGVSLTVNVTVKPTPATSFDVPESLDVNVGSTVTITPTNQVSCDTGFTFESSFIGIASVDANGVVTGNEAGSIKVKVSCGELYKFVTINVKAGALFGMTAAQASAMTAVTDVNVPVDWDFTWSGKTVNDNVILSNDDFTSNKLHITQIAGNTVFENNTDCLGMISGISGTRTESAQMALWTKVQVPDNGAQFRLWAKTPTANPDMLDQARIRVVVYVPNEDYTSFTAYTLSWDGFCDYGAAEFTNSSENILTYKCLEDGHFFTFATPDGAKGKVGFLSIEAYSIANEGNAQTRAYVRRFGWCW